MDKEQTAMEKAGMGVRARCGNIREMVKVWCLKESWNRSTWAGKCMFSQQYQRDTQVDPCQPEHQHLSPKDQAT